MEIEEAVAVLDEKLPGWEHHINVVTLNMRRHTHCILGQLSKFFCHEESLDSSVTAVKIFGDHLADVYPAFYPYSENEDLKKLWIDIILKKRSIK